MEVLLSRKAQKYLDRISEPSKSMIINVLNKLEREPQEGDIKPIAGQKGFWRARAGDLRILYTTGENRVFVTNIVPRGQAYNKKERQK